MSRCRGRIRVVQVCSRPGGSRKFWLVPDCLLTCSVIVDARCSVMLLVTSVSHALLEVYWWSEEEGKGIIPVPTIKLTTPL